MRRQPIARLLILAACAVAACSMLNACNPSSSAGAPTPKPVPTEYSVAADVSGLDGQGLILQDNAGDVLSVSANGTVTFASKLASGGAYAVTVKTQPINPGQTCTVANGSGTVAGANVTIAVACVDDVTATYTPAPKGDPVGTATTQTVDASGGTVTSGDGLLHLTIPAGAFTVATQVSIQPISNTSPNGLALGYRLEPEGTKFAVPVMLTFQLSGVDALALDSTFVVSQETDGLWYSQPHQIRDSSAGTVSVSAAHFSDWTLARTLELNPASTTVHTESSAVFVPTILFAPDQESLDDPGDEPLALPAPTVLTDQIGALRTWEVNSIEGGNTQVGTINEHGDDTGHIIGSYASPGAVPKPATITISLTFDLGGAKVIAVAAAQIVDTEYWDGTSDVTMVGGNKASTTFTFVQTRTSADGLTRYFDVASGVATVTVPATTSAGCTQTIAPKSSKVGTKDGSMTAVYDETGGLESINVSGGGTTVWLATYTVVCPGSSIATENAVSAEWWPTSPGAPVQIAADNAKVNTTVSSPSATGTLTLTRRYSAPAQ